MRQSDNTTPHKVSEYNENVKKTIPFYELFHQETIDLVKTIYPKPEIWLDTGCGTGYLVNRAFPHFPHTLFILTDPSESMLLQAKKHLQSISFDRIRFLNAVATEDLPESLGVRPQVITAIMCHHYLKPEQRRQAVKKCFDLLDYGGVYITFENIRPNSKKHLGISLKRWKEFQLSQGRGTETVEQHLQRFDKKYFPITIDESLNLLKECGFISPELFWYSQMQAGFYAIK